MTQVLFLAILLGLSTLAHAEEAVVRPPDEHHVFEAVRGVVELRTYAVGSLRPRDKTVVPSPINGKVEWVIDDGARVKKGDEIVRIDNAEYADRLDRQKLERAVAQAEMDRAKLEEQLVREQLEFEVRKAELDLDLAQLRRDVLGDPTPTEKGLSELTVAETRFAMEAAEREYSRLKTLGEKGIESGRTIALARLKHEGARADHLKAVADHELLMKGDPAEDIAVADQELERAKTKLELARQRLKSQAAFQATQVKVAEVALARIQSDIELQQDRIDRSRVVAPIDGTVFLQRFRGVPLRAGDQAWASNRLVEIADVSAVSVEAIVNQVDWRGVEVGQAVELRLVAYPGKLFHGVVRKVGRLARDRSLILDEDVTGVMSFYIEVDVEESAPELRPSFTVRAAIVTDRIENCVAVPRPALRADDAGNHAVMVRTADGFALRSVRPGPADARRIVIEEGLDVGDRVIVPGSAPSEEQ